jgi:hypothetical protein
MCSDLQEVNTKENDKTLSGMRFNKLIEKQTKTKNVKGEDNCIS